MFGRWEISSENSFYSDRRTPEKHKQRAKKGNALLYLPGKDSARSKMKDQRRAKQFPVVRALCRWKNYTGCWIERKQDA